ncbi:MAG: ABC transporter substrate-binding protein [Gemmatimonadetes bacterium]|nr:ABC transporter substrate-binding protein [Gemmatimonadota bacterium]
MKRLMILAATLAVASCGTRGGGDTVYLGATAPFGTGYGTQIRHGIELAVEELNKAGGIGGKKVEVIAKDDSASGSRGVAVAEEFVSDPKVVAVIGHANSVVSVATARSYDGRLVAISPSSSSPDLTGVSPWVFRTINSDSLNGVELARFAASRGHKRAALLYENDAFGRGLIAVFQRAFPGQVVAVDPINASTREFEPLVTYYRTRVRPDVVFVVGTEGSGIAFIKEARRQQLPSELIGADGWSGIVAAGSAVDGVIVGAPFSADATTEQAKKFVAAFKARWNALPDGFAACAYDATMIAARAIAEAGNDRAAVRTWLATMKEPHDGATGRFTLGANGDPQGKSLVMLKVKGGQLVNEAAK